MESVVQSANAKISLREQLFLIAADDLALRIECAYIKTLVSTSAFFRNSTTQRLRVSEARSYGFLGSNLR